MIPKPLNEIEWSDIEALKDSGREEDDTIEYKASFSGGSDYLAFNDSQRIKAVGGIAKEAIAFLNGRGGDIVIGVKEAANDHPKIDAITPIANVDATVDRLGQALTALIEPTQSVLGVRAVRQSEGATDGVIIIRAPSSLRAPHRSTRTKECYVRRGRESVPMHMDEVQDLTVRRTDLRRERLEILDSQMSDLNANIVGRSSLDTHRFHIKMAYIPYGSVDIAINNQFKSAMLGRDPRLKSGDRAEPFEVAFPAITSDWRPILRGARVESLQERASSNNDFFYRSVAVRRDGLLTTDFACRASLGRDDQSAPGVRFARIVGFLANSLMSIANAMRQHPTLQGGVLRVGMSSAGLISMYFGEDVWGGELKFPSGVVCIPDCEIFDIASLLNMFSQFQIDVASVAGVELETPYEFAD